MILPFCQSVWPFLVSFPCLLSRTLCLSRTLSSASPSHCWHSYPSAIPSLPSPSWRKVQHYLLYYYNWTSKPNSKVRAKFQSSGVCCPYIFLLSNFSKGHSPPHQSPSHFSQWLFQTFHFLLQALYSTLVASSLAENCFLPHWEHWGYQDVSFKLPTPTNYNLISIHTHPSFLYLQFWRVRCPLPVYGEHLLPGLRPTPSTSSRTLICKVAPLSLILSLHPLNWVLLLCPKIQASPIKTKPKINPNIFWPLVPSSNCLAFFPPLLI